MLQDFLAEHPTIEIDICESVLNGGWEALEQDRVDLVVGCPGPVPAQKGYRAICMLPADLVPVIASCHEQASTVMQPDTLEAILPGLRRVVTHDTSTTQIARSTGLSGDGRLFFVQNTDLKLEAILAGIGTGHLPRHRIQGQLDSGELVSLALPKNASHDYFFAWKTSNRGKGLRSLTQRLSAKFSTEND